VILFRRAMVKLACQLANELDIKALISGENVGQVSSQTISNIHAISSASTLPILRPIAGNNKEEIILTAKEIETYEYSIAPHQDCCSFFLPLHPELKGNLKFIEKMEESLNNKELYETAMMKKEVYRT
jgi:thiamine biosynthesis protein ThiI